MKIYVIRLDDLIVAAYGRSNEFLPSLPIAIVESSVPPAVLRRDPHAMRVTYVATSPGDAVFRIESFCNETGAVHVEASVTITGSAGAGST